VTPLSGKEMIAYGLKLKLIKRIKHALGDIIAIEDNQAVLLTYFRNNVLHLYILPSLIAALVEHNGRLERADLINVIKALYPFLKAELFLKWDLKELEPIIDQYSEALVNEKLITVDHEQTLYSPTPNSDQHKQLLILAKPVKQSLERYFMTIALITQRGSGKISGKQVEELSHLLGQRLSVLYDFNSPEFFDKALFQSFLKVLTQLNYIEINDGLIEYKERLSNIAQNAHLVLDESTLHMLEHITTFDDEELKVALEALAQQKTSRLRKKPKTK
jgi:glycerol-3-phosphate O-acyltransferase